MSGRVVWITGLPASGKSTLAERLAARLQERGVCRAVLDSDAVRASLSPPPGYGAQGRDDFYTTLARMAALLAAQDMVVVVAATANLRRYRELARELAPGYIEVHVDTGASECEARDPKGLYAAARKRDITNLPGVGSTYEPPERPDVIAHGGFDQAALEELLARLTKTRSA
jgi:adenylylsulfate kinase